MKPTNKETIKPIMQFALSVLIVRRNQTERANKRIAKASHSRCSVLAAQQPNKQTVVGAASPLHNNQASTPDVNTTA